MQSWSTWDYVAFYASLGMYAMYIPTIIWSTTRPTVSTWACWLFMDVVVLGGMYYTQEGMTAQLQAYTIGTALIVLTCIVRRAALGWKWYDTLCTALTIATGVLSVVAGNAYLAVGLGLAAMVIGSGPLLINNWRAPEHEPLLAWLCNLVGATAAVLAVEHWTLANVSEPVFLALSIAFNIVISRQYWPSRNKWVHQALSFD